jgi:hypothetical protein
MLPSLRMGFVVTMRRGEITRMLKAVHDAS